MRDLLARYRALREDHLRYLVKCGVIRPVLRTNADTFFAFPDLRGHQAGERRARAGRRVPQRRPHADGGAPGSARVRLPARRGAGEDHHAAAPAAEGSRRSRRADAPRSACSDTALAEEYFRAASALDDGDESKHGGGGGGLSQGAGARSVSRRRADQPRQHPLQPRRARRGAGAVRARDRPRVRFLRGALQPRATSTTTSAASPRRRPATARRCGSIRSTPTRTSTWRSRSRRWGCRRTRVRTGARTSSSRRRASGSSWRGSSRSRAEG